MVDTGQADDRLVAALARWVDGPTPQRRTEVLAALVTARVFVAITATSTAAHRDPGTGLRAESSAVMSLLTLVGSAGGRAVPLFLDAGAAVAFRAGARPVPLPAPDACRAALDDGAVAVLLDPPGASLPCGAAELQELAAGRVPIAGTALSSRRSSGGLSVPDHADAGLLAALARALAAEPVTAARLLQGPDGLVLGVVADPDADLDPAGLAALAARVLPRVRDDLPPGGLDVAVVTGGGPGLPVPLGRGTRRWWARRDR